MSQAARLIRLKLDEINLQMEQHAAYALASLERGDIVVAAKLMDRFYSMVEHKARYVGALQGLE